MLFEVHSRSVLWLPVLGAADPDPEGQGRQRKPAKTTNNKQQRGVPTNCKQNFNDTMPSQAAQFRPNGKF